MSIDNIRFHGEIRKTINAFYRRMVERAYSVTQVRPSVSVSVRDGVSNLRLSFLCVSNLYSSFFG